MDAPQGTYIAYATAPGKVAWDGLSGSKNSPFVSHLLEHMSSDDLKLEEVFKNVRRGVIQEAKKAGQEQIPWEASCLTEDFFFKEKAVGFRGNSGKRTGNTVVTGRPPSAGPPSPAKSESESENYSSDEFEEDASEESPPDVDEEPSATSGSSDEGEKLCEKLKANATTAEALLALERMRQMIDAHGGATSSSVSAATWTPTIKVVRTKVDDNSQDIAAWVAKLRSPDANEVEKATARLANLVYDRDNAKKIAGIGMKYLVDLLRGSNTGIITKVLGLLNTIDDDDDIREVVGDAGGMVGLVALLGHPDEDIVKTVSGMMVNYACNEKNKERIVAAAGVKPLAGLLKSSNERIVRNAAAVIGNIGGNAAVRRQVGSKQVIDSLATLLSHTDDDVRHRALNALSNLSCDGDTAVRIASSAAEQLFRVARLGDDDSVVRALSALINTTCYLKGDEERSFAIRHMSDLVNLLRDRREKVTEKALMIFGNIDSQEQVLQAVGDSNALQSLVALVSHANEELAMRAAGVLVNLACHQSNAQRLLACGLTALVKVLSGTREKLMVKVLAVLHNLSCDAPVRKRMAPDVSGPLVPLLQHRNDDIVAAVCNLLVNISCDETAAALLSSASAVPKLLKLVSSSRLPPKAVHDLLAVIINITNGLSDSAKKQLADESTIRVFKGLQTHEHDGIASRASKCLRAFRA